MVHLTVGIPVYNGMPHLPETVASLLAQSHRDFELLVIDDGSTDRTPEYLNTVRDSRIRVIRQENRKLPATLNRLLRETGGPWHVRQDADDIALPGRLQRIVEAIASHPDAGMFYSPARYLFRGRLRAHYRSTIARPEVLRALTRSGRLLTFNHSSVVLSVEKTLSLGGYREDLSAAEDQDLWWRMALQHDIRLIPEPTIAYRLVTTGQSSASLKRQSLEVLFCQYLLLSQLWNLPAASFADVAPALEPLLDLKLLEFRSHLRQAGFAYDTGRWGRFAVEALRTGWSAPAYLTRRLRYEQPGNERLVVNGVDPLLFAASISSLWPHRG